MNNHYSHDNRTHVYQRRRLAAWLCLATSLLLLGGTLLYSFQTGILPGFAGTSGQLVLPGLGRVLGGNSSCSTPNHPSGDSTLSLNSGGLLRTFIVHLPPSYGQEPQPVVFNYHGYDNTAARMVKYTNMGVEADRENFIVVFPQGADDGLGKASWNAGIGPTGTTGSADDVQFTRDMISYLQKNYCIDMHRIYVTGYSIGASMAYRVACTLSNQIAALATVEGAFYHFDGGCQPTRPIPVLEIHGQADQFAP
ncbi:MAG: alpha/beta hydrolase family esterase, partial [Ktedonobacteraceae bacterium]